MVTASTYKQKKEWFVFSVHWLLFLVSLLGLGVFGERADWSIWAIYANILHPLMPFIMVTMVKAPPSQLKPVTESLLIVHWGLIICQTIQHAEVIPLDTLFLSLSLSLARSLWIQRAGSLCFSGWELALQWLLWRVWYIHLLLNKGFMAAHTSGLPTTHTENSTELKIDLFCQPNSPLSFFFFI